MEGFPEIGEMEPIEIEEFEEVEFEPRMQRWGSDLGCLKLHRFHPTKI
jgi:hypothetical protein